jgi:hypothetical protein
MSKDYIQRLADARFLLVQAIAELDDRDRHPVLPVSLASNRIRDALKILSTTTTGDVAGNRG